MKDIGLIIIFARNVMTVFVFLAIRILLLVQPV